MATSEILRPIMSDVDSNDAGSPPRTTPPIHGNKRKRTKIQRLQAAEDVGATLDEIMKSKTSASIETAILYMMHRYNFDFDHLKKIIDSKHLDVSFSRVTFTQIAHLVGLDPDAYLSDTPLFPIHRARITKALFEKINDDICVAIDNYGAPIDHENEEARSRTIAPLFTRTVAQFNLLIKNSPESIIEGRITRKGRIEHLFRAFGGVHMLFIEVKYRLTSGKEYYDAVAQVIAEADACDFINVQKNLSSPVYGILCDGESFQFFCFDHRAKPKVSMGYFPFLGSGAQHDQKLKIRELLGTPAQEFLASVRAVCEAIFYVLLVGYNNALEAYYAKSVQVAAETGIPRNSTPHWIASIGHAKDALRQASEAAESHAAGNVSMANELAESATEALQESVDSAPPKMGRRGYSQLYRAAMETAST